MTFLQQRIHARIIRHALRLLWSGDERMRAHYAEILLRYEAAEYTSLS